MSVAFRSQVSLPYAARTNSVLAAPAGLVDNDILIAMHFRGGSPAPAVTPPAGFIQIGTEVLVSDSGGFNGKTSIFWKRAAAESGSYTFTHTAGSSNVILMAFSGCVTSGSPVDANSQTSGTGPSSTALGITTTVANALLLFMQQVWDGDGAATAPSGFPQIAITTLLEAAVTTFPSAGATGSVSGANANLAVDPWSAYLIGLKPAAAPGSANATASVTLGVLTSSATATVKDTATASITLGVLASSATAAVKAAATASIALGALTSSAAAVARGAAVAAPTLGVLTSSATAAAKSSASGTATLGILAANASATTGTSANASGSPALGALTSSAAAAVTASAQLTATLAAVTSAASAAARLNATASINLGAVTASASAAATDSAAPANVTLGVLLAQAIANSTIVANLSATLSPLTSRATVATRAAQFRPAALMI